MAYAIEITSVETSGTDSKGNAVFEARGTLHGKEVVARTIQYSGEPIFKLQEVNEEGALAHLVMSGSSYNRGQRIAVARAAMKARLAKFSDGHKELVESELETGETVELAAK